ncbi:TPA: pentapeptide repeat-containing protein [Campylobacter coli]|nr:pentapeptide repeat-containing protein [Campylobacter coli]
MEVFDKEKAIKDIANGLNIENDKIIYTNCYDIFQIGDYCVFHLFQINESCISIIDAKIFQKYNLYFFNCEIPYLRLDFFENFIKFQSCVFNSDVLIRRFGGSVLIENSTFKGHFNISRIEKEICKIHIDGNTFEEVSIFYNKFFNFYFENNSIRNITINENSFKDAYFNYNIFEECIFYKNSFEKLSFYGSSLKKPLRFFQNTIRDSLNIVNVKINFTFDDLQETINANNHTNFLEQNANDFRDSFRNFKSALIKDNNLLEASNFHKYELYCKELELKFKKLKIFSREWIEKWQLFFYRKLCDHHTDLLKAFHNLLIVVMLFGIFSFALDKFKQPSHIENDIKYNIVKVDSNENYIFKEHNKTTYNLLSLNIEQESDKFIKNDFVYMIVFLILVLLLLSFNIFTSIYIFGSILYLIFSFLDLLALYTHIAVIVFFVLFALKFILLDDRQRYKRGIVVAISYTVCIFTLLVKPSLLLPALGSFLDKDSNATYPLLLSLSVVYFMLVVLVLFSLQKTARKNSIVPS